MADSGNPETFSGSMFSGKLLRGGHEEGGRDKCEKICNIRRRNRILGPVYIPKMQPVLSLIK
jgi:hypothetical protein